MTPDTAALRALVDTYVTGWYLTAAEVRALCDAADEVERLRAAVVERDTRLAETIRYHDARVNRADEATDASRTAHAALVAELRAAEAEWHDAWSSVALDDNEAPVLRQVALAWLSARAIVRALLDRHAPTTGETP